MSGDVFMRRILLQSRLPLINMAINEEHEVLGELEVSKYNSLIEQFTLLYGNPKLKKRLAISFWDPAINKNVDTRIRITNGKAEIMQKTG